MSGLERVRPSPRKSFMFLSQEESKEYVLMEMCPIPRNLLYFLTLLIVFLFFSMLMETERYSIINISKLCSKNKHIDVKINY